MEWYEYESMCSRLSSSLSLSLASRIVWLIRMKAAMNSETTLVGVFYFGVSFVFGGTGGRAVPAKEWMTKTRNASGVNRK